MRDNILFVFDTASPAAMAAGLEWYPNAHDFALSLDSNVERAAGIVSALSPLSGWTNNRNKATQLYSQKGTVEWNGTANGIGLSQSVKKAVRIYNGECPLNVLVSDKTRAFFQTIVDPNGDHNAVIDRHAFSIAVGVRCDDKAMKQLQRKGEYDRMAETYRNAAGVVGIGHHQLQTVVWCEWRQRHGLGWY